MLHAKDANDLSTTVRENRIRDSAKSLIALIDDDIRQNAMNGLDYLNFETTSLAKEVLDVVEAELLKNNYIIYHSESNYKKQWDIRWHTVKGDNEKI